MRLLLPTSYDCMKSLLASLSLSRIVAIPGFEVVESEGAAA